MMRQWIKILLVLREYVPIAEILAWIEAAQPLPANWRDDDQVADWLEDIGVDRDGPTARLLLAATPQEGVVYSGPCLTAAQIEADVRAQAEVDAIDPATIAMLIQAAIAIAKALGWLRE